MYYSVTIMLNLVVQVLGLAAANSRDTTPRCKAIPGTAAWPSAAEWSALNASISGHLIRTVPPGAVCHPDQPTFNNATCKVVQAGWLTTDFHARDPVSTDENNWNNDTCLPYPQYPCSGKGYPIYVVNATTPDAVRQGVLFAAKHRVRLVVKGTGHDYMGRSVAPHSLSIWTHHMRGLTRHSTFTPAKCKTTINTQAITALAGNQMLDINAFADSFNLTVVSGGASTVGVGGYLTGGGHGILAPTYGLAADNVLEMTIVTPRGRILTINECRHTDLFWAMRGGGGSTFGILLSVTVAAYPSTPFAVARVFAGTLPENRNWLSACVDFLKEFPSLAEKNIAGYPAIASNISIPEFGPTYFAGYAGAFFLPLLSAENTTASLTAPVQAIIDRLNARFPGQFQGGVQPALYPSFYAWWKNNNGPLEAGEDYSLGSWLLTASSLTDKPEQLRAALANLPSGSGLPVYLVSGKGVANAKPRGGSNAVNPAWRKALVHTPTSISWAPFNEAQRIFQQNLLTNTIVAGLRALAPESGAYVNEADINQPDWQRAFWGDNYARLLKIKKKVDPEDTLWCFPCVGSEGWEQEDGILCRK